CPCCRTLHLDATGEFQVTSEIHPVAEMRHEKWFVLPGSMAWYYSRASTDYRSPPPFDPRIARAAHPISVEFPLAGAQIFVPVEMSGHRGSLVATAYHTDPSARIFWHLNGSYLGETVRDHAMEISPPPGEHELALVDAAGHSRRVRFRVLARDR
ncbi:MAG: penicillin-binding protein 1C, partial [Spirochaetota bacterium]